MDSLVTTLNYCKIQAKWHYKEYTKFSQYVKYYESLSMTQPNLHQSTTTTAGQFNPPSMQSQVNSGYYSSSLNGTVNVLAGSKRKRRKKKKKNKKPASRKLVADDNTAADVCDVLEDDSKEDFELDTRFQEFLRQSAEFRKQRDVEKLRKINENKAQEGEENLDNSESVDYVDVMKKGPDGSILPPTALSRKEMYEKKYGEKGTAILSLETALQWKCNKFTDNHMPKPWPSLQLKFS